jgi:hypothetical protein
MPTARRKTTAKSKPKAKASASPAMGSSQKAIYSKLKKKGMSDKQAHAFSKHAAKRKDSAAAKKSDGTKTATKRRTTKKTSTRKSARGKK